MQTKYIHLVLQDIVHRLDVKELWLLQTAINLLAIYSQQDESIILHASNETHGITVAIYKYSANNFQQKQGLR